MERCSQTLLLYIKLKRRLTFTLTHIHKYTQKPTKECTISRCGAVHRLLLFSPARLLIQEGVWWVRALANADSTMVTWCPVTWQDPCFISMATAEAANTCEFNSDLYLFIYVSSWKQTKKNILPRCVRLSRWRRDVKDVQGWALGGCAWWCGWTAARASGWL